MKFTIEHNEMNRSMRVLVDGEEVGQTNYDDTGWSGLKLLQSVAESIAVKLGAEIERTDAPDEEE